LRAGAYAEVEITRAAPHHLVGTFREQTAEARHRIKIPVATS
jgi:tRNA-2-methylthio-N6-dimethylallyladenosine synthase